VRGTFLLLVCLGAALPVCTLLQPQVYRIFVDRVIIGREAGAFAAVIGGYLGIYLLQSGLLLWKTTAASRLQNSVLFRIRHRLLCRYLGMDFEEYEQRSTGEMKMRMEDDVSRLADFGGKQTVEWAAGVLTALVSGYLILQIQWQLALFSMLIIPLTFYADHRISLQEKKLQQTNRGNDQAWNSWLLASLQGWKEIKALHLEKRQMLAFVGYAHHFAEYFSRWIHFWVLRTLILPKVRDEFLMKFSLYFLGGLLIMNNRLTIGSLLVFAMYYDTLSSAIRTVSSADAELESSKPFYNRVLAEVREPLVRKKQPPLLADGEAVIRISGVDFSYSHSPAPVIRQLSLEIHQGERLAITGPSGSGKSTLLKLIAGMLAPNKGSVAYQGTELHRISRSHLYGRVGIIRQDSTLFNLSIRDNLRLANPRADEAAMDEACEKACILDFIRSLPQGYDTVIGEKGLRLSGGQRQRLLLARLFLRKVEVMVMDEATSSIDPHSERLIHEAILGMDGSKTVIIIAHRASSVALCRRVFALA
jgi:ABC-type bacteriocin/lantibiotic exporter with double-glycine peptidase domain